MHAREITFSIKAGKRSLARKHMRGTFNEFSAFNFQVLMPKIAWLFFIFFISCPSVIITILCVYAWKVFLEHKFNLYLRVNSFLFRRDTKTVSIGISVEPHDRPKAHVRPIHLSLQGKTKRKKARIYWLESRQLHIATRISRALRAQLVDHEVRFIAALSSRYSTRQTKTTLQSVFKNFA